MNWEKSINNLQKVNYDLYAHTFSQSRKGMKWEEITYFLDTYKNSINQKNILDIWCGNGRLLEHLQKSSFENYNYIWIDSSLGIIAEAKKIFPNTDFFVCDMMDLETLWRKDFEAIFFIASFHHLQTIEERLKVLESVKNIIKKWSTLFMTNWALESEMNFQKYHSCIIPDSKNKFWSQDFIIKIGEFDRYYHSFSLEELEYLFKTTWYEILENRLFENQRNMISVITKK